MTDGPAERGERGAGEPGPGGEGPQAPLRVVAIGASAGGLAAFERFFRAVEPPTGLAYVVVQHLSPEHESILPQLLGAFTGMPVVQVADGARPEPDHVYVIPPNATLTLREGRLRLSDIEPRSSRQPISAFLGSLADEAGPGAVAVILSGTGSDGAAGLHAVRARGGLTLVQSPSEAQYDSMPRSAVATGDVDMVLPAADMPSMIARELRRRAAGPRPPAPAGVPADPLQAITEALRRQTGKEFGAFKRTTLLRRVRRRLEATGSATLADYLARLDVDAAEAGALAADLMIGVTRFFRDPAAFTALAELALPRLLDAAGDQPVRAWVPGCATGEEAYSIAIQLAEHARAAGLPGPGRFQIFATDINDAALAVARTGRYPAAVAADVPPDWLGRWLVPDEGGYAVAREIRDACIFSTHDVLRDPPFSRIDLVSCRNLLIYIDPATQARLLPLFHYALRPNGFLFLGASETVGDLSGLFEPVDQKHRLFRRSPGASPRVRFPLAGVAPPARARRPGAEGGEGAEPAPGAVPLRALTSALLDDLSAAAALVDVRGDARYFAGPISRFLPTPTGAPTVNLLELATGELQLELSAALQAAAAGGRVRRRLAMGEGRAPRRIDLTVRPHQVGAGQPHLLVLLREVEAAEPPGVGPADERTHQLEEELLVATDRWRRAVQELESTNEELRSANEELQTMNEELQSSNEELQLSQEELQSVNEELNTVNTELAAKAEEVNALYADLQNLFQSTRIATVVLDAGLRVSRFTPAATRLYPLAAADLGRPLADLASPFAGAGVLEDARAVLEDLVPRERLLEAAGGGWHLLRALPYLSVARAVEGVVLTFVDVSEVRRAEQALRESEERHRAALEAADRRKDEFLAVLGHELRNPLAALGTALRLEEARVGPGGPGARHLAIMRRQVGSLGRLVDDLLDVTRISRGKIRLRLAPVDLAEVTRAELADHQQAEGERLRLELRAPPGPVWVRGDAERIAQVAGNLIHNACKFSEPGGLVEVEVSAGPDGPALTVRDHGVGMDAETMAGLFQPFRQAEHGPERGRGGLGLGLSLVKGLVERMGGVVTAASGGPGRGATFRVRLPASEPPADAPAPPAPAAHRGRPLRVVVVDDNPDVRASLVEYLAALRGHQVTSAGDCDAAIEEARRVGAEVLLCDVGLPGASGLELARRARQEPALRGALLVALTGYGTDADRARSLEAGFDAHLNKPVDLEALDRLLEAYAERGRPAPSLRGQAAAPDPQE